MNRFASLFAALLVTAACSADGGTGTPGTDASTTPDTSTTPDSSTTTDRPATTDVPTTTDRPATTDVPASADAGNPFGACGMATVRALCMCGMDATCQGNALGANRTCAMCYGAALNGCCPAEAMMVATCAQAMMCSDEACVASMCRMQYTALQRCFVTAQQSNATCQMMLGGCFGAFPPACT